MKYRIGGEYLVKLDRKVNISGEKIEATSVKRILKVMKKNDAACSLYWSVQILSWSGRRGMKLKSSGEVQKWSINWIRRRGWCRVPVEELSKGG